MYVKWPVSAEASSFVLVVHFWSGIFSRTKALLKLICQASRK